MTHELPAVGIEEKTTNFAESNNLTPVWLTRPLLNGERPGHSIPLGVTRAFLIEEYSFLPNGGKLGKYILFDLDNINVCVLDGFNREQMDIHIENMRSRRYDFLETSDPEVVIAYKEREEWG